MLEAWVRVHRLASYHAHDACQSLSSHPSGYQHPPVSEAVAKATESCCIDHRQAQSGRRGEQQLGAGTGHEPTHGQHAWQDQRGTGGEPRAQGDGFACRAGRSAHAKNHSSTSTLRPQFFPVFSLHFLMTPSAPSCFRPCALATWAACAILKPLQPASHIPTAPGPEGQARSGQGRLWGWSACEHRGRLRHV